LVNYSVASFPKLSAKAVLLAAPAAPWQNSNPLKGRVVIIGGAYRAARDKYVTPMGYLDGIDILAMTVASIEQGITVPTPEIFFAIDLTLGILLLTATWFLHRLWVLVLSFLLIPFLAILFSIAAFNTSGYFFSFVPILIGVIFHKLVESTIEHSARHRGIAKELEKLKAERTAAEPPEVL
jgi:CHASE2 domain-containing sensor protein